MILIGLHTGLRLGELRGLHWEDIDPQWTKITVRHNYVLGQLKVPKSNKPREVPLSDKARAALKAHRHLRRSLVFSDEAGATWTS